MKILEIRPLAIPDVKVVRYARFSDERGYFTETFRKSDFFGHAGLGKWDSPHLCEAPGGPSRQMGTVPFSEPIEFKQCNESRSRAGVVRGLHFQWNPFQGKLVRTIAGHMLDLALDIRLGSPTFGRIIAYDMPASPDAAFGDWIWLPPGFAHGACMLEASTIEYFCTSEWSPGNETGISPLAADLDWSLCDPLLMALYYRTLETALLSPKDREGFTLAGWKKDGRSENFVYGKC